MSLVNLVEVIKQTYLKWNNRNQMLKSLRQWLKWQLRPSLPVPVFLIKYSVLGQDAKINWTELLKTILMVAVNNEVLQSFLRCDSIVRTGRSHKRNEILSEEIEIFVSHVAYLREFFVFLSDFAFFWGVTSKW